MLPQEIFEILTISDHSGAFSDQKCLIVRLHENLPQDAHSYVIESADNF